MRVLKFSLIALIASIYTLPSPTSALAGSASILLSSSASTVQVGDSVRVAIYIDSNDVPYNRAHLSFLIPGANPATPNEFFTIDGFETNGSDFTISESQGTSPSYNGPSDCYFAARSMPSDVSGKHYFATIKYTAKKAGTFIFEPEFGLCTSSITSIDNNSITINSGSAIVTVTEKTTPPTATVTNSSSSSGASGTNQQSVNTAPTSNSTSEETAARASQQADTFVVNSASENDQVADTSGEILVQSEPEAGSSTSLSIALFITLIFSGVLLWKFGILHNMRGYTSNVITKLKNK